VSFEDQLIADGVTDMDATKTFIKSLETDTETKTLVVDFQQLFLLASPLLVTWKRDTQALAPILYKAKKLLMAHGCKGKFSAFLKAIGDFPRATADRYADAYAVQQNDTEYLATVAPVKTAKEVDVEKNRLEEIETRTLSITFATVQEKEQFKSAVLETCESVYGNGKLGQKMLSNYLLAAAADVTKRIGDGLASEAA
jgi:hypothetical protein